MIDDDAMSTIERCAQAMEIAANVLSDELVRIEKRGEVARHLRWRAMELRGLIEELESIKDA